MTVMDRAIRLPGCHTRKIAGHSNTALNDTLSAKDEGEHQGRCAVRRWRMSRKLCKVLLTCKSSTRQAETMSPFESTVKDHRQQRGMSQEDLARRAGVSRQTIMNIERGLSEPKVLLAITIAAILGVAVTELFRK